VGTALADIDTTDPSAPPDGMADETPAGPALKIFINYRHEDVPFAAAALYCDLSHGWRDSYDTKPTGSEGLMLRVGQRRSVLVTTSGDIFPVSETDLSR
jgi:hypothetical protein